MPSSKEDEEKTSERNKGCDARNRYNDKHSILGQIPRHPDRPLLAGDEFDFHKRKYTTTTELGTEVVAALSLQRCSVQPLSSMEIQTHFGLLSHPSLCC